MKILHLLNSKNCLFLKLRSNLGTGYKISGRVANVALKKFHNNTEVLPNGKQLSIEENVKNEKTHEKVRIRRYALLLSYFGDNYHGMQRSLELKTIEGELLQALHKSGSITAEQAKEPYLIQFQITARTDKGVSAAKQVVSLKMAENHCVKTINEYLPEDIRLFSVRRVTDSFYCKKDCSARTYSYTLPTFALAPELHSEYPENYRISEESLLKVNELLLSCVGMHNFHNFTIRKNYADPSAKRYIMHFTTGEPFVEGIEFITLTIKGQSFMLHQIRKMVGFIIGTLKGLVPPNIQHEVWTEKKFGIPKAPGLGLLLENIHFDWYNKKFVSDGIHESLAWEDFEDEVQSFRKEILSRIIKKELEEKLMFNWIQYLQQKTFEFDESKFQKEINSTENDQESLSLNKAS